MTGALFRALCSSDALRRQLSDEEDSDEDNMDVTLMEALAECYQAASRWETRRQILSIMADKVRYKTLLKFIPVWPNIASQKPNAIVWPMEEELQYNQ